MFTNLNMHIPKGTDANMHVTDVNMHVTDVNMHVTDVNMHVTDVNIDVHICNMHVTDMNMHVTDMKTLFPNVELNLLSQGSGCPLQAGTGHGLPGRAPG